MKKKSPHPKPVREVCPLSTHGRPELLVLSRSKALGSAMLPIAVLSDVVSQARQQLGLTREELSRISGVQESKIEIFETRSPGDLRLSELVALLHGLGCRLVVHPVWKNEERLPPPILIKRKSGIHYRA